MIKSTKNQFSPNYAVPPGTILQEWLDENKLTQVELADRMGRTKKTIHEIIKGTAPITAETSLQLEKVTGVNACLWNSMEVKYREFRAREVDQESLKAAVGRLRRFSYKEMAKRGWVPDVTDQLERVQNLLRFFGVAGFDQWQQTYTELAGAARESSTYRSELEDLSAWLRHGEIQAAKIKCEPYSEQKFCDALCKIRKLTAEAIERQNAELPALCASAGVAHVMVSELPKTHVSGFTRWLSSEKALIQQSLRHKRDDHLWFTFFHEAAHILLHGKKERFLEFQGRSDPKEDEANKWARDFLVPPSDWESFMRRYKMHSSDATVVGFAKEQGIAPGIVAGRIQRETKNYAIHHTVYTKLRLVAKKGK